MSPRQMRAATWALSLLAAAATGALLATWLQPGSSARVSRVARPTPAVRALAAATGEPGECAAEPRVLLVRRVEDSAGSGGLLIVEWSGDLDELLEAGSPPLTGRSADAVTPPRTRAY